MGLGYYAKRLEWYQVQFLKAYDKYVVNLHARAVTAIAQKLSELARSCRETDKEGKASVDWSQVVSLAYGLRYDTMLNSVMRRWCRILRFRSGQASERRSWLTKNATQKFWQCIVLLGHLHGAYETFVESALHFETFKWIRFDGGAIEWVKNADEKITPISRLSDTVSTEFGHWNSKEQTLARACYEQLHCVHAKVQLLMYLLSSRL